MIRLFAALAIPPEIAEGLVRRQAGLSGAQWRPTPAFHITLRFFGDLQEAVAADLDVELARIAAPSLDLELSGVGAFGEGRDIHAVWAGVSDSPALTALHKACERATRRVGLAPDSRRYMPHVTLAYLKRANPVDVAQWIADHNLLRSPSFRLSEFGLYSSRQTEEGSRYRLERAYPL
ncbi:MAG: RNA 2',3'-cyclic phosphodiesterase [Phenylobacterium zucineum]|nr:MAG: RNA 2',3'-cyclic phosphodiesterase [Phenylobacterium zucineum]